MSLYLLRSYQIAELRVVPKGRAAVQKRLRYGEVKLLDPRRCGGVIVENENLFSRSRLDSKSL